MISPSRIPAPSSQLPAPWASAFAWGSCWLLRRHLRGKRQRRAFRQGVPGTRQMEPGPGMLRKTT